MHSNPAMFLIMSLNEKRGRGCKHEVGKCFEIIPIPNGDSPNLTKVGKFCAVLKDSNVKKGHLGILRAQIDPSQVFAITNRGRRENKTH